MELLRENGELPEKYGRTRVALVPVEPYLVHVYWEVSGEDIEKLRTLQAGRGRGWQPVLRFHDITYIVYDGTNAHGSFDIEIDLGSAHWYVPLWSPEKSYVVDLGYRSESGEFHRLARSNCAVTPPAWPSSRTESHGENPAQTATPSAGQPQQAGQPVSSSFRDTRESKETQGQPVSLQPNHPAGSDPSAVAIRQGETTAHGSARPVDPVPSPERVFSGVQTSQVRDTHVKTSRERIEHGPLRKGRDLTELSEQQFSAEAVKISSSPGRWGFGGSK